MDSAVHFDPLPGIRESWPTAERPLPLIMEPVSADINLLQVAQAHRKNIRDRLFHYGGILFRGFADTTVGSFSSFMTTVSGEPLQYTERSSPRHEILKRVYTSTDHPANQEIFLHNEQSYNSTWPLRIFFHCVVPPAADGATPIADCRSIYQRIGTKTRQRLMDRDYCYIRNFGGGLGLGWREAFQTDDRSAVERYCQQHEISYLWTGDERLTTRQIRPVVRKHPVTGATTWFNHLTFFNIQTLGADVAKTIMSLGRDNIPNNTYYGDGTDIEPEVIAELRAAYESEKIVVPWRAGDILLLDNMLVAHGREPFTLPRQIVVGMTEPCASAGPLLAT
jgi:alpha-ketoglutarate-dependent taurine dioxygenase